MHVARPGAEAPSPPERDEGPTPALVISDRGMWAWLARFPTFEALRFREFRLLWLSQLGASLGMWMDQVSRGWLMYELTGSALQLGLVTAVRAVPILVLSPLAGSMADRYDRKQQLVWAQAINAMLNVMLGALVITRLIDPWHIYATGILASMVQVFQQPARQSMTPEAVDRRRLTNAIGLNSIVFNVSRSVGPAIAGLVIAAVGAGGSYLIQGGIYLITTIWTMQIGLPGRAAPSAHRHQVGREGLVASIGAGWRYIWRQDTIRAGIIVSFASSLFGMPMIALLPVFAKDVLVVGPQGQGLLLTGMGIGGLSAAFLIASFGDRLPRGRLMLAGLLAYGLAQLAFASSHWFGVSMAMMILIGLCNVSANALVQTVIQAAAASDMRGRVNSVFQQGQVLTTVGSLLAGTLAELWAPQPTVALLGLATIVSGLAIFFTVPRLRTLR